MGWPGRSADRRLAARRQHAPFQLPQPRQPAGDVRREREAGQHVVRPAFQPAQLVGGRESELKMPCGCDVQALLGHPWAFAVDARTDEMTEGMPGAARGGRGARLLGTTVGLLVVVVLGVVLWLFNAALFDFGPVHVLRR